MVHIRVRVFLSLLGFFCILVLSSCTNKNEDYIQGHWYRGDLHFSDEWYFDRGRFEHIATLTQVNPVHQVGRYRVLESNPGSLTIEVFDMPYSFGDERYDIKIIFDREKDEIRILGKDYYRAP